MFLENKHAVNNAMYHDMLQLSGKKMSFGMMSYWALTLLSPNGKYDDTFDSIEDDVKEAVINHTPALKVLTTLRDADKKKNRDALLLAYEDTMQEISESATHTLKFITLAALDHYRSGSDAKQRFQAATGLNEAQAETIVARLQTDMIHLRSPSFVQQIRDITTSSPAGMARNDAADTVMYMTKEANYKYTPNVYAP